MSFIAIGIGIFCLLYLVFQLWQWLRLMGYKPPTLLPGPNPLPKVCVLIAARNEEALIGKCLDALIAQDYPKERMFIRVGNDQSTDQTKEIVKKYIEKYPTLISITDIKDIPHSVIKAKARVMAQIDHTADFDYFLITDADVAVNPKWIAYMVGAFDQETGISSGTTIVEGKSLFEQMQGIDWAYFMGILNIISNSGVPATAVGNNMAVKTQAYQETGGYGAIQFSITEDYKLYSEVCKKGWKWKNIMHPQALAFSGPIQGFIPLLHQRKRWLSGGKELPWYWWVFFVIFGFFYVLLPALFFFSIPLALIIWGLKWIFQSLQINKIYSHCGMKRPRLQQMLQYEMYLWVVTLSTGLFFLLPIKTLWKGRKY